MNPIIFREALTAMVLNKGSKLTKVEEREVNSDDHEYAQNLGLKVGTMYIEYYVTVDSITDPGTGNTNELRIITGHEPVPGKPDEHQPVVYFQHVDEENAPIVLHKGINLKLSKPTLRWALAIVDGLV